MLARLNRKSYRLGLGAVLTAAVLAVVYYLAVNSPRQAEATQQAVQTTVVRQGDLILYASGSGTLVAGKQLDLGVRTNGTVAAAYVQPGEAVRVVPSAGAVRLTSATCPVSILRYFKAKGGV